MCSARIAANEGARRYERHRPEKTLLYQIIDEYYPQFLFLMEQQGRSIPGMCKGNLTTTSSVVAWNMAFCVCAARTVIMSGWWLSVVKDAGFVPAVVPGVWLKVLRCLSMMSYLTSLSASGC